MDIKKEVVHKGEHAILMEMFFVHLKFSFDLINGYEFDWILQVPNNAGSINGTREKIQIKRKEKSVDMDPISELLSQFSQSKIAKTSIIPYKQAKKN